ncbi:endonuclease domain-containing protein [Planomonospora corallina]|uniref:Endonuclease domain-containing protein n=1 Tax=Planomonospora corallina TaxID=1806052 RepID=A0ABV8IGM8_9ACTN
MAEEPDHRDKIIQDGVNTDSCSFQDCGRPVRTLTFCKTHYDQHRIGQPLKPIRSMIPRGTYTECSFPGCGRPHSSQGYCDGHYQQKKKGFTLTPLRGWISQAEWGSLCRYGTCQEKPHSRGLCIVHYGRGISQYARDAVLALQGGRCLCGTNDPGATGWQLDHAHECDQKHKPTNYCAKCVRGMLCLACNRHGIAWYENTYKPQHDNQPIVLFEQWINRRVIFHGAIDSPDVTVSYVYI